MLHSCKRCRQFHKPHETQCPFCGLRAALLGGALLGIAAVTAAGAARAEGSHIRPLYGAPIHNPTTPPRPDAGSADPKSVDAGQPGYGLHSNHN